MENETENQFSNNPMKNWIVPVSIVLAGIIIAGAVFFSNKGGKANLNNQNNNTTNTASDNNLGVSQNDAIFGDPSAPVTIIEFADYQCPYCAKFVIETQGTIEADFIDTKKAKLVFKDLAFLGPESINASLAAKCAREQGKFWEFHDAIFSTEWKEIEKVMAGQMQTSENNGNLNLNLFKKIAGDLGMNVDEFTNCYNSKKYENEIKANLEDAKKLLGQSVSTPSFIINGKLVQGAQPYTVFKTAIEEALNK